MRTTGRILAATAVMGGSLLFAAPASAQTATTPVCTSRPGYPFDCPVTPPVNPPVNPPAITPGNPPANPVIPIGGGTDSPATGETPGGGTGGGGTGGGGTVTDNSPVRETAAETASLPFTGGEVTLVALTGLAALAGGAVLVAAGRKRAQA